MRLRLVISLLLWLVVACGLPKASAPGAAGPSPPAAPSEPATVESVICEFLPATQKHILEAVDAALLDENEARPTRAAIDATEALATRATNPTEKADLASLASAMDAAALSGEGYLGWSPSYEAFYVKYATQCGWPLAN